MVFHILIFIFLDNRREHKEFWIQWLQEFILINLFLISFFMQF
jgi:hypothetical protein